MTPSAEQIALWKKEAEEYAHKSFPANAEHREYAYFGYKAGRQAAFEEVARLQAENVTLRNLLKPVLDWGQEKAKGRIKLGHSITENIPRILDEQDARVAELEGLLREYMENGHREPWYRKVTSALSEKQKPDA